MQSHQSRHMGRTLPEGAGPRQSHRCSQAIAGRAGRTVEHLYRLLHSLRRADRHPWAGCREEIEGGLPNCQQGMVVGAILAAGGRRHA
eukprot:9283264-Alexandrium_andersonii.AAC.1